MTPYPQKITFAQMHNQGCRRVLVYCRDHQCLSDVEPRLTCSRCGKKGAELRPDFPQARMGAE